MRAAIVAAAIGCLPIVSLFAQQPVPQTIPLESPIPFDSSAKIGTLPNGLRYYIRKNSMPKQRAELRLIVNAGSVLEKDDQLGLAHFIEHMAFNGTTHFAKNDLVSYLQSVGVRFGADLNASTSFDETEYFLPVPTDKPEVVDRAFTILADWAHGQIFDSAQVVGERGVVHEEWRLGRGAGERMLEKWFPIVFRNSVYAQRIPIGTEQSIMTATPSRLRAFYNDWYRPDLMAVVAVGDFDPAVIEAQIKMHFSGIPAPVSSPERKVFGVAPNATPVVAIATDKEATSTTVSLMYRQPRQPTRTVADIRRDLTSSLYLQMLNARLADVARHPDAAFLSATASIGGFLARDVERFSVDARVTEGGAEKGLQAMMEEVLRANKFGFLESELQRARANTLREFEHTNLERDKSVSAIFAEEFVRNFLEGEPIPGIENEYRMAQQLIPGIALADVNAVGASWMAGAKPIVLVQAPERVGATPVDETSLLAALDRTSRTSLVAYTENVSSDALVDDLKPAGRVISQRTIPTVGITEMKLSNGARVIVKPTDFKADEVLFAAYAPGGTSLASDRDFMSAQFAAQIEGLSGLGKFDRTDLVRKLSGKEVSITSSITEAQHELTGRASPKDLETLLQLVYLEFTGARLDTAALAAFWKNVESVVEDRGSSPDQVFGDTIQVTLAQHDFRARPLTRALLAEVNPQTAIQFFKQRFAGAGKFTFVFVGNVDTTALRPLVEKYLASLPVGQADSAVTKSSGYPRGIVEKTVRKGLEPKATTIIAFAGDCSYTPENRFAIRAVVAILQDRLNRSLREQLGKTYSPSVRGGCNRIPREQYLIPIQFGSSTDSPEPLTKAVFALIDSLKTSGPSESDVEKVKEQMIRSLEVDRMQNTFWLASIFSREQAGEDLSAIVTANDKLIAGLTADKIRDAARKYFDFKHYARFILLPEAN